MGSPGRVATPRAWEPRSKHCSELGEVAAYVPDLLLSEDLKQESRCVENFHGVLLFADVSGFTALTEKFSQSINLDQGADEVAQTLNQYMGDILEELLAFGGDVLKFAGDAVLVLWRVRQTQLRDTVGLVLQCSQQIQAKHGTRDTDVGLKLRLKIGVSAGHMSLLTVGDKQEQRFLIVGQAVGDVWQAQNLASAGDVILSAGCWELCNQSRVKAKCLKGQKAAVKVTGVERMSLSEREDISSKVARARLSSCSPQQPGVLRPAVTLAPRRALGKLLRKYLPATVLRKLDDGQPLEYLSELRPVTCLFVKLQFAARVNLTHIFKAIQDSSVLMSEILRPHKGEINKISMFDKGCTFLCVFGLPGQKVPCESVHALESAVKISRACLSRPRKIEAVSVGVTSGTVFCGVVGHRVRHEYTVMGQKVNLAARLMEHYPGVVSCDAATYAASRLPRSYFRELPEAKMKGVVDPGTVYQYLGISEKPVLGTGVPKARSEYSPLLGREKELALFESHLNAYVARKESHILAFEGAIGSGKSHLLSELACLGQAAGHRVVAVELTELNQRQVFSAVHMVLAMAMGLQACKSCSARQLVLQEKLRGLVEESSYCLLNVPFLVKFPLSEQVSKMSGAQRTVELESVFKKVLQKTVEEDVVLFIIDNAQYIDPTSWAAMSHVLRDVPIFLVVGFAPGRCGRERLCKAAADIVKLQQTTYVQLEELQPAAVVQKACHDLGVVSVPRDLETFLMQRSYGIPYYCEELLSYLRRHDLLLFQQQRKQEKAEAKWENLFRIALAELDSMKPSERMVLKCAAIIGRTFTPELLFHLLPRWTRTKMYKTLDVLVKGNCLKWLSADEVAEDSSVATKGSSSSLQEASDAPKGSAGESETARLRRGVLAFCAPLLREAAYELWPKAQRVAMHGKCAAFLERRAHKCRCCGGGDFVPFHRLAVGGSSSSQEGESCDGTASERCSPRREASLAAEEELERAALRTAPDAAKGAEEEESCTEETSGEAERFAVQAEQVPAVPGQSRGTPGAARSCECKAVVELVLVPLAHHHTAMGNDARALYYLLESAAACLHVSDNYLAFTSLRKAEALRSSAVKKASVPACFEEATFLSLQGEVCYNVGRVELAKTTLRKALSLLGRKFPGTSAGAFFQLLLEQSAHASHQKSRGSCPPAEAGTERLPWLFQQSRCLSLLRQLFSLENTSSGRRLSLLAALMRVNAAEESEDASHILASYLEYVQCCQELGRQEERLESGRAGGRPA
ncbi:adenylate cyclase type 10-like [Rhea pennata]|uniref:adenylate cyclase type 10-like n=1 Tax=Rhea pennata TaxID=8795 RepID=UPI002E27354E